MPTDRTPNRRLHRTRLHRALRLAGAAAGALLLSACAGDMSDLQAYVEEVKARPGRPIEPIPEIRPFEGFAYPGHQTNPFDPGLVATAPATAAGRPDSGVTIDPDRPREYLESFPLDTLRMVGTLEQQGQLWGLIRTPDGTIQRVTQGNYMGQNYGKIIHLDETGITLREIIPDGFGGYMERETSVALSE